NNLGDIATRRGAYERAAEQLDESLRLFQALGDSYGIAMALNNSAHLAFERRNLARAAAHYEEGLRIGQRLGNNGVITDSLAGLAGVAAARGYPLDAARLYSAAEALRKLAGSPWSESERAGYDLKISVARASVDKDAWEGAWAEGG